MSISKITSNVFQFPGKENRELAKQKKRLAVMLVQIDGKMNMPCWDILDLSDLELQALANFGETMKFTPTVASRLASVLAASILKKQNEEYEL
jgi:hypothetical protein